MNRRDLVDKIAAKNPVGKGAARDILSTVLEAIVKAVSGGESVTLSGFGTFKRITRAARRGFNPREGLPMKIPAKHAPKFVPAPAFEDTVDKPPNPRKQR
jgi:DNA-binding protein HU-beta